MKKTLLALFLVFSLFPIGNGFSQEFVDEPDSDFGIQLTSFTPYNYKDEDGTTVIIGEVENKKTFPVTGIKVWAGFYDNISEQPLETAVGTTILDVIPPLAKSPYVIRSQSPNAAIVSVSVNLLGFNSSPAKQQLLSLEPGTLNIDERMTLSGTITNDGEQSSADTKIHLISYDSFIPPRILAVETTVIEDDIEAGSTASFEFDAPHDSRAVAYKLVAESNNYQSVFFDITDTSQELLTKLVTINDISLNDSEGNRLSDIEVGSQVNIQSKIWIQFSADQETDEQPYIYYVQIKQSGEKAYVEFIGKAEGVFETGGTKIPVVEWIPESEGLYFVETFVWDPNAVPLASKGPISLILVK